MNILSRLADASFWGRLEWSVLAQVTGVILAAALLARCVARRHAAARHGIWLGALAWVLLSPVIAVFVECSGWTFWAVSLPLSPAAAAQPPEPVPVGRQVASQSTVTLEPSRSNEIPLVKPASPAGPLVVRNPRVENRFTPQSVAAERPGTVPAERSKSVCSSGWRLRSSGRIRWSTTSTASSPAPARRPVTTSCSAVASRATTPALCSP
jgi:hypothetical protein